MSGFSDLSRRNPLKRGRFCGGASGFKLVRSSSVHERPTSLGAALTGGVEFRGDQCALQLADRSGSARDRRRRTAGASLSRRGCGRRGLRDGVLGGVGLRSANGRGAGVYRSVRTVRRYQGRYAQGGMAALGRAEGWRRGRRRVSGKRLRSIEMLKSQGMSDRAIAHRMGVSEWAIRKLVRPSQPADSAQLALAGITTAAVGRSPAIRVPCARLTGDDADRATSSAHDRAGERRSGHRGLGMTVSRCR